MHADVPYDYQEFLSQGRWRAARAAYVILFPAVFFAPLPWSLLAAAGVAALKATTTALGPAAYRRYRAEWTRLGNGADPFGGGREDSLYFLETGWRGWAQCGFVAVIAVLLALRAVSPWFLVAAFGAAFVSVLWTVFAEISRRKRFKAEPSGALPQGTMQGA
ncbi:hypothetical protein [Arthrobacter sp. UM1]|uniref:hypothetical protein n=1 Tax=Arthrobacter sp. UM1 TaxID=2766776 RepID=UPI001CF6C41C|nr:hypothetical protein [Arthrobacter sp. UM1]MCB4209041.1 hypothetical protein [Arthrobacter sp. UM1]